MATIAAPFTKITDILDFDFTEVAAAMEELSTLNLPESVTADLMTPEISLKLALALQQEFPKSHLVFNKSRDLTTIQHVGLILVGSNVVLDGTGVHIYDKWRKNRTGRRLDFSTLPPEGQEIPEFDPAMLDTPVGTGEEATRISCVVMELVALID